MKYVLVDDCGMDFFTGEFGSKEEAIREAKNQLNRMSDHDKKRRSGFYVLESDNPDEESINHLDGDVIWNGV